MRASILLLATAAFVALPLRVHSGATRADSEESRGVPVSLADKNYCAGWTISYPQLEEKTYQAWTERIARGYEPSLGKGDDTIGETEKK